MVYIKISALHSNFQSTAKKGITLAEVLMAKQTSGMENKVLHSRESEKQGLLKNTVKHCAFTLAEVLITLAIVGVVAVLTIPSVIIESQKEQTVSRLKKAYMTLSQAITVSEVTNGSYTTWNYDLTPDIFFEEYLDGYIVIKKEQVSQNNIKYKELNGNPLSLFIFQNGGANGYSFTLNNGTKIFLANDHAYKNQEHVRVGFIFDLNGDKGPNRMGKDMFLFTLSNKKGLLPYYFSDGEDPSTIPMKSRNELINGTSPQGYQCRKNKRGEWCSALIMVDGWQIKDDYPW